MLVGDIPQRNSRIHAKKIGLVYGDISFSYSEINRRINRLSNALIGLGLNKGDKVAFMADNCNQFVEAYFAVAKAGLVIVPVNARLSSEEALYVVNHSDSVAFFFQGANKKTVETIREKTPGLKFIISLEEKEEDFQNYESLVAKAPEEEPSVEILPEDPMMIMYTSGATGTPKGVVTSHRNIMANTNTMTLELRIVPEEINLLVMPLYHNGGLWPIMTHFYRGATTILLPRFDVEHVLKLVEKYKVTLLNLVPTMLLRLVSHRDFSKYKLDSLRLIMYAGAPIGLEPLRKAMHILGPHRFYTGLGATEASGSMISFPTTEHALKGPLSEKLGTVGRDSMGVEIKLVDKSGKEVPTGQVGEIIARGDNIAQGYWKMPEETAKTFRGGWLYTGDVGYRDEDGYIFLTDRKKDIIISGGENISSQEVEQAIYQNPCVHEVAVIGVPDKEWGEAVMAVISLKPAYRGKVSEEDIIEFCNGRLSGFKKPKAVVFMDELPKNPVGKIMKQALKKRYWDKNSGKKALTKDMLGTNES